MNPAIRSVALLLLGTTAACVSSEPIGATPQDLSTDTAAENLGDAAEFGSCSFSDEGEFSWHWSFGGYEPELEGEGPPYAADASLPLDCDVIGFDTEPAADRLSLMLDCEVAGDPIEQQQLSLWPIPPDLALELLEGSAFSVVFQPEIACGGGCYGDIGWLSVRRVSDDQVMVGIVDADRLLSPVDELLPLSVAVTGSDCGRVELYPDCPTPGWTEPLSVVVGLPDETVTITASGLVETLTHRIYVEAAIDGENHDCGADGADPAHIQLMVVRSSAG